MFRIFLTNLGKYNEGDLVGEWVDLPVDDDFESVLEDIGINDEYEEWFITDYENDYGYEVGEYDNIFELNEIAERLEDLDEDQAQMISAIIDSGYANDIDEAITMLDNVMVYPNCHDMTDVAYEYIDQIGIENLGRDTLENYFDHEAFGRDLGFDGTFLEYDGGMFQILW